MYHPGIVRASHIVELPCHAGLLLNVIEPASELCHHGARSETPSNLAKRAGQVQTLLRGDRLAAAGTHDNVGCSRFYLLCEVSLLLDLPSMRRHEAWEIARALYDAKRKLPPRGSFRVRLDGLQLGV